MIYGSVWERDDASLTTVKNHKPKASYQPLLSPQLAEPFIAISDCSSKGHSSSHYFDDHGQECLEIGFLKAPSISPMTVLLTRSLKVNAFSLYFISKEDKSSPDGWGKEYEIEGGV